MNSLVNLIRKFQLKQKIKLLGYINEKDIYELYCISDVFFLPSIRDCNPLSTIEAAFSKLALLLSDKIGNVPELLKSDNGLLFNPHNNGQVISTFANMQKKTKNELKSIGQLSNKNAIKCNDMEESVNNLIKYLIRYEKKID